VRNLVIENLYNQDLNRGTLMYDNIEELKTLAGKTIVESSLSPFSKKQMLKFVLKEADESQVKALVLDKEITTSLNGQDKRIINERFDSYINKLTDNIITESINFSLSCREILEASLLDGTPEEIQEMKKFVLNEATDLQILDMIINEKFELTSYSKEDEEKLYKQASYAMGSEIVPVFTEGNVLQYLSEAESLAPRKEVKPKGPPIDMKKNKSGTFDKSMKQRAVDVLRRVTSPQGRKVVGALLSAAVLLATARKIYKSHFSKEAKMCKGSTDKRTCMLKAKIRSHEAQLVALKNSLNQCNKSKNPEKCSRSVQNNIKKVRTLISNIKTKL